VYVQNRFTNYGNNYYLQPNTNAQYDLLVGAYKQTSRPAFPRRFKVSYANEGNQTINNVTLTFTHDTVWSNFTILSNNATPTTVTAHTKTWNIGTVYPNGSADFYFSMELPQNTPIGIPLNYTLNIAPNTNDCNLINNTSVWSDFTTNSFDPNDKTLLNPHDTQGGILNDGSPLRYQIRFQNTGTDTAYTVIVRDTIDLTHLDKSSFKVIGASHNVQTHWEGANILVFEFPNIYLVDSFHNEPKSHGWLQFSILPKANTPLYSNIQNTAAIVFDYNDAVITNTVSTTFVPFLATDNNVKETHNFHLQPNPANTTTRLSTDQTDYSVILTDIFGRTLWQQPHIQPKNIDIPLDNLPAATYFITIKNEKGSTTRKVVKM
jgi:hypothetical protein